MSVPTFRITLDVATADGYLASSTSGHASATGYSGHAAALSFESRARAGQNGLLVLAFWDAQAQRGRVAVGYVGENGIEPNTWYRVKNGQFVKADDQD